MRVVVWACRMKWTPQAHTRYALKAPLRAQNSTLYNSTPKMEVQQRIGMLEEACKVLEGRLGNRMGTVAGEVRLQLKAAQAMWVLENLGT